MHRRRRTRIPKRQPDLFLTSQLTSQPPVAAASPGWSSLPDVTQQAVTALMTRLLITHAAGTTPAAEGNADEH